VISRVTTYKNEKGHTVEAYAAHDVILAAPHKFAGMAKGTFSTPQGSMQLPVIFDIEAPTVEEAFEKFHEACMARGTKMQDDITAQATRARLAGR
jgi:hypothetical protein